MKHFHNILLVLFISCIFASCTKQEVRPIYPFGSYIESTRNGELRKFNNAAFAFDDRMSFYHNPNGDSLLNVNFHNNIQGTNIENIYMQLAKEGKDFIRADDLNEQDSLRDKFRFIFDERYLSKATYVLDSTYPNTFELISISDDKKHIQGKFDFRVVMIESDRAIHSLWAPDTIHHENAVFWINYFE